MAIDNLLRYSKQLAIKLRDPVSAGDVDGKIFFTEFRFGYLTRGFGRLIRNLECLGVDIEYIYPQFYNIKTKYFNDSGNLVDEKPNVVKNIKIDRKEFSLNDLLNIPLFKIHKIIGSTGNEKTFYRGKSTAIVNAFEVLFNMTNEHYNTKEENTFIFFITNGKVKFLANDKIEIGILNFLLRNPLPKYSIEADIDLFIPVEYEDLFLSLAALEGVIDAGDANKVNLYKNEISSELKLLALKKDMDRKQETTNPIKYE